MKDFEKALLEMSEEDFVIEAEKAIAFAEAAEAAVKLVGAAADVLDTIHKQRIAAGLPTSFSEPPVLEFDMTDTSPRPNSWWVDEGYPDCLMKDPFAGFESSPETTYGAPVAPNGGDVEISDYRHPPLTMDVEE